MIIHSVPSLTVSLKALSHQDNCCVPTQAAAQVLVTMRSTRAVRYMCTHPGTAKAKSLQAFCMLLQVLRNKTREKYFMHCRVSAPTILSLFSSQYNYNREFSTTDPGWVRGEELTGNTAVCTTASRCLWEELYLLVLPLQLCTWCYPKKLPLHKVNLWS